MKGLCPVDKNPNRKYHQCRYIPEDEMKTRVQKWGNSLALRVPKAFAIEVGLQRNSEVELSLDSGKLVITPLIERKRNFDKPFENEFEMKKEIETSKYYLNSRPLF